MVTNDGPNKGKPKGRICLGEWGDPEKPDDDLIKIEQHTGTVLEFFKDVAPKKYCLKSSYKGQIKGYLKTLSCDKCLEEGNVLRISRPHDPNMIIGKIEYFQPLPEQNQAVMVAVERASFAA